MKVQPTRLDWCPVHYQCIRRTCTRRFVPKQVDDAGETLLNDIRTIAAPNNLRRWPKERVVKLVNCFSLML